MDQLDVLHFGPALRASATCDSSTGGDGGPPVENHPTRASRVPACRGAAVTAGDTWLRAHRRPSRGLTVMIRILGLLAIVSGLAGCGPATATTAPSAAQEVRVDATGSQVRLEPATIRAGDVNLVVDLPVSGADLAIIGGTGGALSDADLSRLAAGDLEGTTVTGIDNSCCGKVHKMTLAPGKYAFVLGAQQVVPGRPPPPMTILVVTP